MNLLFSCVGRRGYLATWFRDVLAPGDRIVGTTNTLWTPALHACDTAVLMPDIADPGYLPALLELCRSERIDGLLSFLDLDVDLIASERDRFRAAGVTPIVPSAAVSRLSLDKLETARFLAQHGFDGPRTFADLASAEAALRDGSVWLPLVVKPRRGFASRDVTEARTLEELRVFARREPDLLIQERLGGEEHSLDVLCDLDGRVVSVVVTVGAMFGAWYQVPAPTVWVVWTAIGLFVLGLILSFVMPGPQTPHTSFDELAVGEAGPQKL